jgi:hypothetical protein
MPRKRKDPDAAPIDGDYTLDQVLNKDPAFAYALVDPDDMAKYRSYGYVAEMRGPDAAVPAWDGGDATDAGYKVRNLTLMKIPLAKRARIDAVGQRQAEGRMAALKREVENLGGEFGKPSLMGAPERGFSKHPAS